MPSHHSLYGMNAHSNRNAHKSIMNINDPEININTNRGKEKLVDMDKNALNINMA